MRGAPKGRRPIGVAKRHPTAIQNLSIRNAPFVGKRAPNRYVTPAVVCHTTSEAKWCALGASKCSAGLASRAGMPRAAASPSAVARAKAAKSPNPRKLSSSPRQQNRDRQGASSARHFNAHPISPRAAIVKLPGAVGCRDTSLGTQRRATYPSTRLAKLLPHFREPLRLRRLIGRPPIQKRFSGNSFAAPINFPSPNPHLILAPSQLPQRQVFSREIVVHNLMRQNPLKLFQSPPHHHETRRPKFRSRLEPQPHRKRLNPKIILLAKRIQSPQQLTHPQRLFFPLLPPQKLRRRRPKITRPFMERGRPARLDASRIPRLTVPTMRHARIHPNPTPSNRKIPRTTPQPRRRLPQLPHQKLPQPPNLKPIDELPRRNPHHLFQKRRQPPPRNPQLKTNPLDRSPRSHDAPPLKRVVAPRLRHLRNLQFRVLNFRAFLRNPPINPGDKLSHTPFPNLRISSLRIRAHKIRNPPPRLIPFLPFTLSPLLPFRPFGPRRLQKHPNPIQPHMLMRNIESHNVLPFENEVPTKKSSCLRAFVSLC